MTSAHRRYDQRILWRECVSLRENGYDVTLIINDDQPNETLENGIRILSTGFVPQGRRQRMTEGVRRVYELGLAQDGDIYHLHDAELLMVALKLKKHKKKVIFDSHEVYGIQLQRRMWIPSVLRKGIASAYNLYEAYVCKRIDGVIHIGRYNGKDWFAGRSKRFVYVGNFPRMEEYGAVQMPPYHTRGKICLSGSLSKEEGLLTLVEAADRANTKLVLAGKFIPDSFQEEVEIRDTHHVVEYVGFLDRKGIFDLYRRCAIGMCVLPFFNGHLVDNLNTKIYEYMAMEMPVIISDWPYRRKLIQKYHFGLTVKNPSDIVEIAEKIKWLLNHPREAEEMGKNGKRLLEEKFTWDVAEKELLKLYCEISES